MLRQLANGYTYAKRGGLVALGVTGGLLLFARNRLQTIFTDPALEQAALETPISNSSLPCEQTPLPVNGWTDGVTFKKALFLGVPLIWSAGTLGGFVYGLCSVPPPTEAEKQMICKNLYEIKDLLIASFGRDGGHGMAQIFSAWLQKGKGRQFQSELARFSQQFKKLFHQAAALNDYQVALFGDDMRRGLFGNNNELLYEFLDDHPAIARFLFVEFNKEPCILVEACIGFHELMNEIDLSKEAVKISRAKRRPRSERNKEHLKTVTQVNADLRQAQQATLFKASTLLKAAESTSPAVKSGVPQVQATLPGAKW